MYFKAIFPIAACILILQNIQSVTTDQTVIGLPNIAANWSKLILVSGNCNLVYPQDMVVSKTTELSAIPLYRRDTKVEWSGDQSIYCIAVYQTKDNGHPGTITITDGGFGNKYVTIKMESDRGHGLHLFTYVYAQRR